MLATWMYFFKSCLPAACEHQYNLGKASLALQTSLLVWIWLLELDEGCSAQTLLAIEVLGQSHHQASLKLPIIHS
jgi:hypothetical protein